VNFQFLQAKKIENQKYNSLYVNLLMNRVKLILKRLWYKPKVLDEYRKTNKKKNIELKNNYMKIIKRKYHTSYKNPNNNNNNNNNNNLILLGISILLLDGFYNKFE